MGCEKREIHEIEDHGVNKKLNQSGQTKDTSQADSPKCKQKVSGRIASIEDIDSILAEGIEQARIELSRELEEARSQSERPESCQRNSIMPVYEDDDDMIATTSETVEIDVSMDSGAVANTIHPRELPSDAEPVPNTTGKHFRGANDSVIQKFGTCDTVLETEDSKVGCGWALADVSRPLHSTSQICGPEDGPGKQDVLFNNKICVVVPPGVVDAVLKQVKAITKYKRTGNLYTAKMAMSSFRRQGQDS